MQLTDFLFHNFPLETFEVKMSKDDEKVMVLSSRVVFNYNKYFNGFSLYGGNGFRLTGTDSYQFLRRGDVEQDPSYKQIIPYVIYYNKESDMILTYTRSNNSGEQRLASKLSIGFGGHINECDTKPDGDYFDNIVLTSLVREMTEEAPVTDNDVSYRTRLVPFGYVNEDMSDVGRVHFGIVFVFVIDNHIASSIRFLEDEIVAAKWMQRSEFNLIGRLFETWSSLCFPAIQMYLNGVIE